MKNTLFLFINFLCYISFAQNESYLETYDISKDSVNELTFKSKKTFESFIAKFEYKEGFELPKFFIIDNSGKLLKHKLDIQIRECGKGDINKLKKRYFKNLPTITELNAFFNEKLEIPNLNDFVVIFVWHASTDKYNKHTFDTYHTWKENDNIKFYFLELNYE